MAIFKVSETEQTHQNSIVQGDEATEAEAAADLARAFPMMVCGDVQSMRVVVNEARGLYEPQRAQYIQSRILPIAMRLKNQGSVFGYPLVTDVAAHLYNFVEKHKVFDSPEINVVNNDVLLLQNILWKKISGDGGKAGQEILAQLI